MMILAEEKRNARGVSLNKVSQCETFGNLNWSERRDLNPRPFAPEANALPDCATLRLWESPQTKRLLGEKQNSAKYIISRCHSQGRKINKTAQQRKTLYRAVDYCAVDGCRQPWKLTVQHKLERYLQAKGTQKAHHPLRTHMDLSRNLAAFQHPFKQTGRE